MNIALILSGGKGVRLGSGTPKQYQDAGGKPVILYCMEQLLFHDSIDGIQIVADSKWQDKIRGWLAKIDGERKFRGFSDPGPSRQMSIYSGLNDIRSYADDMDNVFIHDAARPMLTSQMISQCLESVEGHEGAMPALPMKDTVYASRDGRKISALLDRGSIYAGQAPEVFKLGAYYEANRKLLPESILKINGSAEPAVLAGMDIAMIPGDENNFKITTRADLERFRRLVEEKRL